MRVLIVEDNTDARVMLTFACEGEGHVVHQAENGRQALERLAEGPCPDVILLDLAMPVMDGWQFREVQQSSPDWASIPVVIVSAHDDSRDVSAIAPRACFRKPVDIDALLETLVTIVRTEAC
jgi:two-component system, chemotaxis family, chemotaxis protein CheY